MAPSDVESTPSQEKPFVWRGAALGVLSLVVLLLAVHVGLILATPFPNLAGLLFPLVRLMYAALFGVVFWALIVMLGRAPSFYLWAAVSSTFLFFIVPFVGIELISSKDSSKYSVKVNIPWVSKYSIKLFNFITRVSRLFCSSFL